MKKMTKVLFPAVLALTLVFAMTVSAFAELVPARDDWTVSFTEANKMVSNFKTQDMDDQVSGLQPGDYTDIVLTLKNENKETVDWYMTNKVIKSLEDTRDQEGLAGGAYTYILTFKNTTTGEEKILFSSEVVGGDSVSAAGEGLHEATDALDQDSTGEYLFLDTFNSGEGGTITLRVGLDGETQGNDYQDTFAELEMKFAVELKETEGGNEPKKETKTKTIVKKRTVVVRTGDETNSVPYLIAAGISGLVLLLLAVYSLRERRRQRGGRA